MKKIYPLFLLALLSVWLASCKSASKLYEKGNYDEAVSVAVKKLQKDPNDQKLRSVVQDAYRYAVTGHENRIQHHLESDNDLKWEWIYSEYSALQNLYNTVFRSPVAFELVKPIDYSTELNTYASKAADVHYNHGVELMSKNDKQSYKIAYREFQTALRFKPGDPTIRQMVSEAYEAALTHVVVIPADGYGFRYSSYNYQLQNFENEIIRTLQQNAANEFVKFYTAWDAQRQNIVPDEFVEMHFTQINLGRMNDKLSTKEVSREVVIKEKIYKPDSVVKEYAKVKAQISTTHRTIYSEGNLHLSIRNKNGLVLLNDNIVGSHGWTTEYTTFTGDERALSDDDKALINKTREDPPHESEIMQCIKENIYTEFISRIRNYYSRY